MRSLVTICLLTLAGCILPGGTRPLVKIGLAAPFEGFGRPLGYEALAGVKLALAERNAAGGIGGYMVELVALNDFGEPEEARLQASEFTSDPAVVGVVTGWTSEMARASLPLYQQASLAVVVPWSVSPELADRDAGVVLVAADEQRVAKVLVKAVAATRPRRVVVVGDEPSAAPYAESLAALGLSVQTIAPPGALGGETPVESPQGKEWATYLTLSRARPPDALILATDSGLAGEALLALAALNWTGAAFGGVEVGSVHLVNVAGEIANGLTFASPAPAGRDVQGDYGNLSPRGLLAYDAANVLLDAVELAGQRDRRLTRSGVAAALPTVRRSGLTGAISFDRAGRRLDAPVWLYEIVDNDYPGQMLLTTNGK